MSVKAMNAVWEDSLAAGNDLVLLLAIADCANDEGTDAWPSQDTLAAKARMSVRTVQRSISSLKDAGELRIDRASTRETNVYTVVVAWNRAMVAVKKIDRRQVDGSHAEAANNQHQTGVNQQSQMNDSSTPDNLTSLTRQDFSTPETRQVDSGQGDTHDRSVVSDTPTGGGLDPSLIRSLSNARARGDKLSSVPRRRLVSGPDPHAAWPGRFPVHQRQHERFMGYLEGRVDNPENTLWEFYKATEREWTDGARSKEAPDPDMFKFWEARFREHWPPSNPSTSGPSRRIPGVAATDALIEEITNGRARA